MLNIYLDQKIWIELSKIFHRSDMGVERRRMASYLEEQVWRGRIRCPVGEVHIIEAAKIGSRRQRMELASIFCRFSGGWFLMGRQQRVAHEIDSAMRDRFNEPPVESDFSVFSQEMFVALGGFSQLSAQLGHEPEELRILSARMGPFLSLLSYLEFEDDNVRRYALERLTASSGELVCDLQRRREQWAGCSKERRRRGYAVILFDQMYEEICASVLRLGKNLGDLRALNAGQLGAMVDDVPCFDVECLLVSKLEQQSRVVELNDLYDIWALTAAVPYFDAVVTEAFWVKLCEQSGIRKKYKARGFSSLAQVCCWLEEEGS